MSDTAYIDRPIDVSELCNVYVLLTIPEPVCLRA